MSEPLSFDEDFVRGAAVRELSAAERVATAQRIAADHRRVEAWRAPPPTRGRPSRSRRHSHSRGHSRSRTGRRNLDWRGLWAVALVAGLLLLLAGPLRGLVPYTERQVHSAPPRPADAQSAPLGRPPAAPEGEGGYAFLLQDVAGRPLVFDPCRPIHYVVNPALEPVGGRAALDRAIAEVSYLTGLRFVFDGTTDEDLDEERPLRQDRYGERWAPVLVGWSTGSRDKDLAGDVAGYAGPRAGDDGGLHLVTGLVVLDAEALTRGGKAHPGAHVTAMHELAHLVGLAHVDDPDQLMHAKNRGQQGFADGDRRGLARVGSGDCAG